MVNIPDYSKSKVIKIESNRGIEKVTISEFEAVDVKLVEDIQAYQLKLPGLMMKVKAMEGYRAKLQTKLMNNPDMEAEELEQVMMNTASEIDESKFTEKDLEEIENMAKEAATMKGELAKLTSKLAQRGLKRFYYQNEPEFLEAERNNQATKFIDSQKDIKCSVDILNEIALLMIELGKAPKELERRLKKKADGKGKYRRIKIMKRS